MGNNERFNEVLEQRLLSIRHVLAEKSVEYATDSDRFHNFKVAARVLGTTPYKALWGMFTKHLVSIMDIVEAPHEWSDEVVGEKIGDAINYLILLEGMIKEYCGQTGR